MTESEERECLKFIAEANKQPGKFTSMDPGGQHFAILEGQEIPECFRFEVFRLWTQYIKNHVKHSRNNNWRSLEKSIFIFSNVGGKLESEILWDV